MRKNEIDPYEQVELSQLEKLMEYAGVGIAGGMIIFFFLKVLFF